MAIALIDGSGTVIQVEPDGAQFDVAAPLTWVNVPAGTTVEPYRWTYDAQTGTFSQVPDPRTLAEVKAGMNVTLHRLRLALIAGVLGTTLDDLPNAEARVLRVSQAAQDALANPAAWHGKTLAKQTLPTTDAGVVAAAQTIIDQQRAMNEQIEQINIKHDALAAQVAAATTISAVEAIKWQ